MAREPEQWEFGRFRVTSSWGRDALEDVLDRIETGFARAGFRLEGRVDVESGVGRSDASAYFDPDRNIIRVMPQALQAGAAFEVLVHEMSHWYHHNVVPGGFRNGTIIGKYHEVMEARPGDAPYRDLDALERDLKALRRKLTALVKRFPLRRMQVPGLEDTERRSGGPYVRDVLPFGFQAMSGDPVPWVRIRIDNPSPSDLARARAADGDEVRTVVPIDALLPAVPAFADELRALRTAISEAEAAVSVGRRQRTVDRYDAPIDHWLPTEYSKTDPEEWFAELMTTAVLRPGRLPPEVEGWLRNVT